MQFRKIAQLIFIVVFVFSGFCYSEREDIPSEILEKFREKNKNRDGEQSKAQDIADINSASRLVQAVNENIDSIKSYNAHVEYLFEQPLFESSTLRKGRLYFERAGADDANSDRLAVNFRTVKQDDQQEQLHRERYVFDGVWLTHIDYKLEQIEKRQLASPNKPADVFELASRNFPIIGFSKFENLEKDFDMSLERSRMRGTFHLVMKVRDDSDYDEYKKMEVWINKKNLLPGKIIAFTKDDDVYNMRFFAPEINSKIPERVFDTEPPPGFPEPRIIKHTPENTGKNEQQKSK